MLAPVALNRAADPEWVREEYERTMGRDALERQVREAAAAQARKNARCSCDAIRQMGGNQTGPHHSVTCSRWAASREGSPSPADRTPGTGTPR